MSEQLQREGNKIRINGDLQNFHVLLTLIHQCIDKAGYNDVVLDMSKCTSAFQNSMLSVCAQVIRYRAEGIDFTLVPPESKTLHNLFRNTNWGYFLDPGQYELSRFRGHTRIPATQYRTPEEQQNAALVHNSIEGRWCADAGRPTRFKPSSPSPTDAVRDGSAKLGHPVQNVTREHGLTPLPR